VRQRTSTEFHPGRNAGSDAGFTLLELLVVIAILGLLTALVVPKLFNVLSSQKTKLATQQIDNIGGALDLYKLDAGSYPTTEQGLSALVTKPNDVEAWSGPYIKTTGVPADPWNHPFTYANPSGRGMITTFARRARTGPQPRPHSRGRRGLFVIRKEGSSSF
jgi:general secretion pathway protein G